MNENENIIEIISKHTKVLLLNHWPDINDFRNGAESMKIGFSHDIGYEGQKRVIETTISFGKRVKDSTIDRFDTDQMALAFGPVKRPRRKAVSSFSGDVSEPESEESES